MDECCNKNNRKLRNSSNEAVKLSFILDWFSGKFELCAPFPSFNQRLLICCGQQTTGDSIQSMVIGTHLQRGDP